MSEEKKAVMAEVKVENGIIKVHAEIDVIDALEDLAAKSDNTVDDALVKIVAAARENLDWKGVAKELM